MHSTSGRKGVHEAMFSCACCDTDLWLEGISDKLTAREKVVCATCGFEQRVHLFYDGSNYCACLIPFEKG